MNRRPHLIPTIIVSFLLLIATLPFPYGYYTFLRWVTCAMAAIIAFIAYNWDFKWAIWIFIPIAILFNPFIAIHLTKEIWKPIDIICAIIFGISAFMFKKPIND